MQDKFDEIIKKIEETKEILNTISTIEIHLVDLIIMLSKYIKRTAGSNKDMSAGKNKNSKTLLRKKQRKKAHIKIAKVKSIMQKRRKMNRIKGKK